MWLSFLRKINKHKEIVHTIDDIPKYMKLSNREIIIDSLTPSIANEIDGLIRFWNISDNELELSMPEREPIKIFINSLGGSADAAFTLVNSIKISRTPVYTFNIGIAYKESFLVYLAGHKRFAYSDSKFMYADSIFEKPIEEENESSFYNKNTILEEQQKSAKILFLDKAKFTEAQYDKHAKNEWWFTAQDAFKVNIVNEISRNHFYCKKRKEKR